MKVFSIHELEIGQVAELTKEISEQDVYAFAELTGDKNPIHMDKKYAEQTFFKKQIVHGALLGGLISAVLGMKMPGPGAIYESQELSFYKPVYFGDKITASAEVEELLKDKNRAIFKTKCINQNGAIVAEGRSVLLPTKSIQTKNN